MKNISIGILFAAGAVAGIAPLAIAQPLAPVANAARALTSAQASQRFKQGEALERRRDWRGSFEAYLEAGEAGDGLAQKKLGDLYSTGNPAVERDYESALRWYHKAREQGIEIPKPISYPGTPIDGARK